MAALTLVKLRLVTVVWGQEFVTRFLDITLRSLASENNLPALAAAYDVTYEIIAPDDDIAWLKRQPVYQAIASRVNFQFWPFLSSDVNLKNAMSHWVMWNQAVERAKKDDAYIITVAADHIFADGAMMRWAELFAQGYLAIYCPGMQVVAETVTDELNHTFGASPAMKLPRDTMIVLMFRHFHPVMLAMCRQSPRWMAHPEFHLRLVPGCGIVQRIMTSHAVAFHPGRISMTENFGPREQFDKIAYEPSWFLSAEPLLKYLNLYLRPWRMDEATLSHYGVWADGFMLPANLIESKYTHHFELAPGALGDAALRRERFGGDRYVAQMNVARSIYRLWRTLRDNSLNYAARWLAAAHMLGRLRRRLALRGPVTILVPEDTGISHLVGEAANTLFANGARLLVQAILGHMFAGQLALRAGDRLVDRAQGAVAALDGKSYAIDTRGPIRVLRGPIRIDDMTLWVIDRPLSHARCEPIGIGKRVEIAGIKLKAAAHRYLHGGRNRAVALLRKNQRVYMMAVRWREGLTDWQRNRKTAMSVAALLASAGRAPVVATTSLALYRSALKAASRRALDDLYGMYQRCVLDGTQAVSAPASQIAAIPQVSAAAAAKMLEQAISLSPDFGAAWFELGFARRAQGDRAGARAAFDRARQLLPLEPPRRGQSDPRALATLEYMREAVAAGDDASALASAMGLGVPPPYPWQFHALKAELLRNAGQATDALIECERSLEWNHFEGRFEGMLPRTLEDLRDDLESEYA